MTYKYVSLFSGIGGFDQAFRNLGEFECVAACEIDKHASRAFQILHGGLQPLEDVRKIGEKDLKPFDVLLAGFPCQAFSLAGRRGGFEDTRGTLVFDVLRIIQEYKPKVVLLENVKGLLNHDKGRTFETIAKSLSQLGEYAFDFTVLNTKHFGLPQLRERVYIVAVQHEKFEPFHEKNPQEIPSVQKIKKKWNQINQEEGFIFQTFNFKWEFEKGEKRHIQEFLDSSPDSSLYLSSEKARIIVERMKKREGNKRPAILDKKFEESPEYAILRIARSDFVTKHWKEYEQGLLSQNRTELFDLVPREDGNSNTLTTTNNENLLLEWKNEENYKIRKLSAREFLKLQGFTQAHYEKLKTEHPPISDRQIIKMAGNAVSVNVIESIGNTILENYLKK